MRFHFGVFGLDLVEIAKLVQPLDADVPQRGIEDLAFLDHDFAPDDFVAGRRVAAEGYAIDVELAVLVNADVQVSNLLRFIVIKHGHGREVDVAAAAIEFLQILKAFAQRAVVVHLARYLAQYGLDHIFVKLLGACYLDVSNLVLIVFLDFDRYVEPIDSLLPERENTIDRFYITIKIEENDQYKVGD